MDKIDRWLPNSTRYKSQLKLKDWAFVIVRRSTKTRIALARRLAIIMHAMLRNGTEFIVD